MVEAAAGLVAMSILSFLNEAIRLGIEIKREIEGVRDKIGILQEVEFKIQNINTVLDVIKRHNMSVDRKIMKDVHEGLAKLRDEVKRIKNIGRFMYLFQRKDCQDKLNEKIGTVEGCLQRLNVNQTSSVFGQTEDIKLQNEEIKRMLLAQQHAVTVNADLKELLKKEREQSKLLRRHLEEKALKLQDLQSMGLGTPDELKHALKQAEDEQKQRLKDTKDANSEAETGNLGDVIKMLQALRKMLEANQNIVAPNPDTLDEGSEKLEENQNIMAQNPDTLEEGSEHTDKVDTPLSFPFHFIQSCTSLPRHFWIVLFVLVFGVAAVVLLVPEKNESDDVSNLDDNRLTKPSESPPTSPSGKSPTKRPTTASTSTIFKQVGSELNGEVADDVFGHSVALSLNGTRMAIGAPYNDGKVRVYDWIENQWTQAGSDLKGEEAGDEFGISVSLSSDGTRLAIGATYGNGDNAGRVLVYDWTGSQWTQVGSDLIGEAAGDWFGWSVALSSEGTRLAIGASRKDGNGDDAGHVRVFDWTESEWTQVGSDLNGEAAGDWFGYSLALSPDGTRIAIGAPTNDANGDDAGHVRVYDWTESQWTQVGSDLNGEAAYDYLGWSVALSSNGTRMAVGARGYISNGYGAGHVRLYDWTESEWTQVGSDLNGETAGDEFGYSMALSLNGTRVAIGAPYNDGNGDNSGHVRVFDWTENEWTQVGNDLNGEEASDCFGHRVALSPDGTRVAIGAPDNDGNGDGIGHVRVYDVTA